MQSLSLKSLSIGVFLLLASALSWAIGGQAGPYHIQVSTEPTVIPVGKATLVLDISDSSGHPVTEATVAALAQMPGMPMGERDEIALADPNRPGRYTAPAQFAMAGGYDITVKIDSKQGRATIKIPVETGQDTAAAAGGLPWAPILTGVGVALLALFVALRMRKTGQHLSLLPLLSFRIAGSLLLLGVVALGAYYAVNRLRPENAMTPLTVQTMGMEMPAPPGASPVVLASAEQSNAKASVEYSAQAVGYIEQDVYPRVTGNLVSIPLYAGDRVRKGEVLAKLDTSQIDPQVAQKQAEVQAARFGQSAAESDYRQALAMTQSAQDETAEYAASVYEASANIDAAEQNLAAMNASADGAQAAIKNQQAILASDVADQSYWKAQADREAQLYSGGYVSKQEYQQADTKRRQADATVLQAQAQIAVSQTQLQAALAQVKQAQAQITAARQRYAEAKAELGTRRHELEQARAGADSAKEKIAQAASNLNAATADLSSSETEKGYTVIRSEVNGVVTQRMISPGVLVSPGQSILKVAQIDPIRIQANVAQEDLASIHVGSLVSITDSKGRTHRARVSSIAPSVDPSSRTGLVEAVLPNSEGTILPGEYVSMDIATGASASGLWIPSSAVQHDFATGDGSNPSDGYVWVADPVDGSPNGYTVKRVSVKTSGASGNLVAVVSGLNSGDQVVTQGAENLQQGGLVAYEDENRASKPVVVEIDPSGFAPNTIQIKPGKATTIRFRRTTDQTCAKAVVFPALGIQRDLPLNQTVAIEIPPQDTGSLSFACGMNMLHGNLVVK